MAGNLKVLMSTTLQVIDNTTNQQIINLPFGPYTLSATAYSLDGYFQVGTTATPVTLPAATVYDFLIINQGANQVTVSFTPTGGAAETIVLQPGGMISSAQIAEVAGGITALSLQASTAITPCFVFTAA